VIAGEVELHPHEELLRRVYGNAAAGDTAAVLADCTDDAVFHVPGRTRVSGSYPRDRYHALVGKVLGLTQATYRESVQSVLVDDERGVVLLVAEMERGGVAIRYGTVHVWAFRDGRCAERWEYLDQYDAFMQAFA